MAFRLFITIFLVILNGFFVAAEFAIVKVRASQLEVGGDDNSSVKGIARHIVAHLDAYLAATQLGITIASIGLGLFSEEVVYEIMLKAFEWAHYTPPGDVKSYALPVSYALVTFMHVVFGELAPKSVAIRYPLPVTMFVAVPLRIFYAVFSPFIWFFNGCANLILRIVGISPISGHEAVHSEEEVKVIIAESAKSGDITATERQLIENIFEFDNLIARQVMIPHHQIAAVDVLWNTEEIIDKVLSEGYSRMPVYEGTIDNVVGIIHTKDLLKIIKNKQSINLTEMIRPALFVPESKRLKELVIEFQRKHIQMAVVVNEFGGTVGIITFEDILEEIVGEIYDEYDDMVDENVSKTADNEFTLPAVTTIIDANRLLPEPLPLNPKYDTISGLILMQTGAIPKQDDEIMVGNYKITILETTSTKIQSLKINYLK